MSYIGHLKVNITLDPKLASDYSDFIVKFIINHASSDGTKYELKQKQPKENNIVILQGLPASGKSYFRSIALGNIDNCVYVNKDEIRVAHNLKDGYNEELVHTLHNSQLMIEMQRKRKWIIVDNTNFREKTVQQYITLANDFDYGYYIVFANTPLVECLRRNKARDKVVPEDFINKLYAEAVKRGYYSVVKETAIIVDIDGTLANNDHRNHLAASKRWKEFYALQDKDTPNTDIIFLYKTLANALSAKVIIVSGRPEQYRTVTEEWLKKYNITYDKLFMRKTNDFRQDYIVKEEIYHKEIEPFYDVKYVIDDRMSVCDMWRDLGLRVLQIAKGDF